MYEPVTKPLLPRTAFLQRVAVHAAMGLLLVFVSLSIGIIGYHHIAGLAWIDALLNAAMIMGGMGPVDALTSNNAKIFASIYALYCGLILLVSVGIIFAPVFHRILHKLHIQTGRNN
jgi:hypothetical protein